MKQHDVEALEKMIDKYGIENVLQTLWYLAAEKTFTGKQPVTYAQRQWARTADAIRRAVYQAGLLKAN